ncbi:MAG: Uncharacterised protein [Formosa sp. Hel1_33_131]|jgi:hypothetical protein|nr:MAG: Uncharacterised protein [Formosa sp. Hel1_33_131]|tara:strand:+ start:4053 stop:4661 length:609 start_codon:yes stop_codon:yes gene_type:complete
MRKIYYTLILTLVTLTSQSQIDYGIKGGLNFNSAEQANQIGDANGAINAENRVGFHLGGFIEAKVPVLGVFVRPEVVFTTISSEYTNLVQPGAQTLTINKIDVPILIGKSFLRTVRVFAGPSFQYIIDSSFNLNEFNETDKDDLSVGVQLGVGFKFGKFGIDARWEKGISNSKSKYIAAATDTEVSFDTRPNQFIIGLSYSL